MKRRLTVVTSVVGAALVSAVLNAQAPTQAPPPGRGTQTPPPAAGASAERGASPAQAQPITVIGCVQREADYRKAQAAGRGGVAGTGVGAANEFILINATAATGAPAVGATAGAAMAYELTGPNERQVDQYVGKRVEIAGTLKPAASGPTGTTGGPTADAPPKGVDVVSRDLKLRELEVGSVKPSATGTCPAA
jgi:hypothetical protein